MCFYVYILEFQNDGWYIGMTNNLKRRMKEHGDGKNISTSHRGNFRLIYYEAYLNKMDAIGREKFLKSGSGRKFLKKQMRYYLIEKI